jgi:hypothetical protein
MPCLSVPHEKQIGVSWTLPASTGGSALTSFIVQADTLRRGLQEDHGRRRGYLGRALAAQQR